jgi:hypothetical protein
MMSDKRLLLLLGTCALAIVILAVVGPIKQDSGYHQFADYRVIANIPNFFNLISNLPFLIIGFLGLRLTLSAQLDAPRAALKDAYRLFFIGVMLTGLGSGYYHFNPDNSSLLWDRLPITLSFMAFFCIVVGDCISEKIAFRLLLPLVGLGIASVLFWYFSELQGQGDLRAYILVPIILWLYGGKHNNCNYVWAVLGVYLLAKLAESLDVPIYVQLQILSGHTLKHLLAGLGTYLVYAALKKHITNR